MKSHFIAALKHIPCGLIYLLLAMLTILPTAKSYAYSTDDFATIPNQSWWYNGQLCGTGSSTTTGGSPIGVPIGITNYTPEEIANALTIIGIAKTENLGQQGAIIGIDTAIDESHLENLANPAVPVSLNVPGKQGTGQDFDSVGIMQQRVASGWSTLVGGAPGNPGPAESQAYANQHPDAVAQLMTQAYAAEAFFGSPPGSNAPHALSKGLQNLSGWQGMDPAVAAIKVQGADPSVARYGDYVDDARNIVGKNWDSAPAIPLPVPLSGPAPTTSGCGDSAATVNCTADATTTVGGLSVVRQNAVCVAGRELSNWGTKTGVANFGKYSQGNDELWCADFVSWVYLQANYPVTGNTKNWRINNVTVMRQLGQKNQAMHWHPTSGYKPKPGDLVINGYDEHHINMVVKIVGNKISVIGGDQPGPETHYPSDYPDKSVVSGYDISDYRYANIEGFVTPD